MHWIVCDLFFCCVTVKTIYICIRREPNTRHAVLINPYYATNFLLVGTLSIGISSIRM